MRLIWRDDLNVWRTGTRWNGVLQMSEKMEQSEKQAEEGLVDEAQALLAEVGDVGPRRLLECRMEDVLASNRLDRLVKPRHDTRCTRRFTM